MPGYHGPMKGGNKPPMKGKGGMKGGGGKFGKGGKMMGGKR